MPRKAKRGSSSISRKLNGGKQKQSSTSHLHPHSSLYSPPLNANENSNQDESDSESGTLSRPKRGKTSNIKRSNECLLKKNEQLQRQNDTADESLKEPDAKKQ